MAKNRKVQEAQNYAHSLLGVVVEWCKKHPPYNVLDVIHLVKFLDNPEMYYEVEEKNKDVWAKAHSLRERITRWCSEHPPWELLGVVHLIREVHEEKNPLAPKIRCRYD